MMVNVKSFQGVSLSLLYGVRSLSYVLFTGFCSTITLTVHASESNSIVRVSVVEYETDKLPKESYDAAMSESLLEQFRKGIGRVVFTGSLMLNDKAKSLHTEVQWVLVPMGFQHSGPPPNPMNYMRRGLGTQVSIRCADKDRISIKMIREYMVGMTEAKTATPDTFVQPTVKSRVMESSIARKPGDEIVGGGWHEDITNKTYYLIARQY